MANTNDEIVVVKRKDGEEIQISRAQYDGVYKHAEGFTLVKQEKNEPQSGEKK